VFEAQERGRSAKYKLTSTVMLVLDTATQAAPEGKGVEGGEGKGNATLSGSMTRQVSMLCVAGGHGRQDEQGRGMGIGKGKGDRSKQRSLTFDG
jgi:hypothetical protein